MLAVAGAIHRYLSQDHARLDALLARAVAADTIDVAAYDEFRAGLLRHIAMEEKVLFAEVRARGTAELARMVERLHADHAALASLLVPTPTHALLRTIRDILAEHNVIEECQDGLYESCEQLAGSDADATLARMQAIPAVRASQHVDEPRIHDHIARMVAARPSNPMLVRLGQRAEGEDVVDLLVACHGRIRWFSRLARELAQADAAGDDVRETARQIHRYFAIAFPLHVADEEELVAPRLRANEREAIATMCSEHAAHERHVARLVELCAEIEREPGVLAGRRTELAGLADRLIGELEAHLVLEEQKIFPALRRLPIDERNAIRDAMRLRREAR